MKLLKSTEIKRLSKLHRAQYPSELSIVLILVDVDDPRNVGAIFRIADACRVDKLLLTGVTVKPPNTIITRVSRNKVNIVEWEYIDDVNQSIQQIKQKGYHICAVELTNKSIPYYSFIPPAKIAILLGNEEYGIPNKILKLCDSAVYIPMYRRGRSLNVNIACAVVCYHIVHYNKFRTITQ